MFAINHAATALIFKRRFEDVSLVALLLSVQAMEFAWVALNHLGVERTTTEPVVRYVGDIHLAYMPYSHSVLTVLGAVFLTWSIAALAGRSRLGAILGFAILSHLILDLLTHNGDIALGPFRDAPEYGTFDGGPPVAPRHRHPCPDRRNDVGGVVGRVTSGAVLRSWLQRGRRS
jgi:LexA-binding, inner membrane-associated putative hydrolase